MNALNYAQAMWNVGIFSRQISEIRNLEFGIFVIIFYYYFVMYFSDF